MDLMRGSAGGELSAFLGPSLVDAERVPSGQHRPSVAPQIVARLNDALGANVVQKIRLIGGAPATPPAPEPKRRRLRGTARQETAPAAVSGPAGIGAALDGLWQARARRLARDSSGTEAEEEL